MSKDKFQDAIIPQIETMRANNVSDQTIAELLAVAKNGIEDNGGTKEGLTQCLTSFTQTAYSLSAIKKGIEYQETSSNLMASFDRIVEKIPSGSPISTVHLAVKEGLARQSTAHNNLHNNLDTIYTDLTTKHFTTPIIPKRDMLAQHLCEMVLVQPAEKQAVFAGQIKTILGLGDDISLTAQRSKIAIERALSRRYPESNDRLAALFTEVSQSGGDNSRNPYYGQYEQLKGCEEYRSTVKELLGSHDLTREIFSPEARLVQEKKAEFLALCEYNEDAPNFREILTGTRHGYGARILSRLYGGGDPVDQGMQERYIRNVAVLEQYIQDHPLTQEGKSDTTADNKARLFGMLRVCVSKGDNGIENEYSTAQSRQYDITKTEFGSRSMLSGKISYTREQAAFLEEVATNAEIHGGVNLVSRTTLREAMEINARAVKRDITRPYAAILDREINRQVEQAIASRGDSNDTDIVPMAIKDWVYQNTRTHDTTLPDIANSAGKFVSRLSGNPQSNAVEALTSFQRGNLASTMTSEMKGISR